MQTEILKIDLYPIIPTIHGTQDEIVSEQGQDLCRIHTEGDSCGVAVRFNIKSMSICNERS